MVNFLISGIKEVSAGKTTIARALIRLFNEKELEVSGFKPRSGNNIWYHWKLVKEGLKRGTIFSKDAKFIREEMNEKIPLTLINPVHRLWTPGNKKSPWSSLPHFLLDRITLKEKQYVILNQKQQLPVKKKYFENLFEQSEILKVSTRDDLQNYTKLYNEATFQAEKSISKSFKNVIYESYSDIALPFRGISHLDFVFVSQPFQIDIYKGERYLKALELTSSLPVEQSTDNVIESIKPIHTLEVTPFDVDIIDNTKNLLRPILEEII